MQMNTTFSLVTEGHPRIMAFCFSHPVQPLRAFPQTPGKKKESFLRDCRAVDALISGLSEIPGVESIETSPYMIVVTRALLHEWSYVVPAVLEVAKKGILRGTPEAAGVNLMHVDPEALEAWRVGCAEQAACWIAYGKGITPQGVKEAPVVQAQ